MPQWARSSRSGIGYQAGPGETVPVMGSSEVYTHGHTEGVLRSHRWRTAENSAGYLLPHLRAGQRLLDLGCGPGTISVDLARRVAPGPVVGVDRAEPPLREARATAAAAAVDNVTFAVGDAYQLDFPAGSFDVVHAHQVLQHLSDPVAALVEMRRVCAPGGWIAVRDADYAAMTWHPADVRLDRWLELYEQVARSNGGEPDAGRRLLSWARAAGLEQATSSASMWCFATVEDGAGGGRAWRGVTRCSPGFRTRSLRCWRWRRPRWG
jgi:SAM-dependent methyltransferase